MSENPTVFTTCLGTFSYATSVTVPRFDENRVDPDTGKLIPIYSTMFLFDKKGNAAFIKKMNACIQAAFKKGVDGGKFNAKSFAILKKPLRDGDEELGNGKQEDPIYKGKMFFNAVTTKEAPDVKKVEDGVVVDIGETAKVEFYSGCIGRLLGSAYPFKVPSSKGIAIGLNGVLKLKEGTRLDGRPDVQSAFDKFADEGELDSGVEESGDDAFK